MAFNIMEMHVEISIYVECVFVCVRACVHLCPLKGPQSSDTFMSLSSPNAQVLVFKHYSSLTGTRIIGEMVNSRAGNEKK